MFKQYCRRITKWNDPVIDYMKYATEMPPYNPQKKSDHPGEMDDVSLTGEDDLPV